MHEEREEQEEQEEQEERRERGGWENGGWVDEWMGKLGRLGWMSYKKRVIDASQVQSSIHISSTSDIG